MSETVELARQTMEIFPLLMRVMAAEMRSTEHAAAAGHIAILGTLRFRPYILSELAELHAVSSPTMSSTITTLEERGWVVRERKRDDRRVVWVTLTDEGNSVLNEIMDESVERISQLLAKVKNDDLSRLKDALLVMRDVFTSALENIPPAK